MAHVYRKVTNSAHRRICVPHPGKKNIYSEVSVLDHEAINQREGTSYKTGSKAAKCILKVQSVCRFTIWTKTVTFTLHLQEVL